jgi:O-methyltransferase involved in polyketide biosynthesis
MQNTTLDKPPPRLDAIAETLLIPLCYRAEEARQPKPLVSDPRAQDIINRLGIDPAHLRWRAAQQVFAMLRARRFDRWARAFLAGHPRSVVVEIGCGLDARFERLDDGQVTWFDLDLPEVIDLRRHFFTDTARREMIGCSVFNSEWMDCIPTAGNHHLFLAEGIFAYFPESEVRLAITAIARRFPGSEMVVDTLSPFMVRSSGMVPWFRGYKVRPRWGVSDPRSVERWGSGIRLLESYGYFDEPEPRLAPERWMAIIPVFRDSARVLHLQLGEPSAAPV